MTGKSIESVERELRRRIGEEYLVPGWNDVVTPSAVRHFADGVGDDNPIWGREEPGGRSNRRRLVAPPTFFSTFSNGQVGPSHGWSEINRTLDGLGQVWFRDEWNWTTPLLLGQSIEATNYLSSVSRRDSRKRGSGIVKVEKSDFRAAGSADVIASNERSFLCSQRIEGQEGIAPVAPYCYSDEEIDEIGEQYRGEAGRRRGAEPLWWEDVSVGDTVAPLVKGPLTVTNIVGWTLGWGSELCVVNRIAEQLFVTGPTLFWTDPATNVRDTIEGAHWNPAQAVANGMAGPYDFGAQRVAWIAHSLTDWAGDDGFLRRLSVDLIRPNLVGDTTWITGQVQSTSGDPSDPWCACDLVATNQRGDITARAEGVIELPSRTETTE